MRLLSSVNIGDNTVVVGAELGIIQTAYCMLASVLQPDHDPNYDVFNPQLG